MRETEYRAWIIEQKRMVWVAGLIFDNPTKVEVPRIGNEHMPEDGKAMLDSPQNYEFWYKGKEAILMQYADRHDKNDRRIYKDDIVRWYHHGHEGIAQIIFKDGCFYVAGFYIDACWRQPLEIIGNTHQNPELLND